MTKKRRDWFDRTFDTDSYEARYEPLLLTNHVAHYCYGHYDCPN